MGPGCAWWRWCTIRWRWKRDWRPTAAAALAASERTALAATRGVVVTSPATAAGLADYGVTRDRIAVVEPGIDPAARSRGTRAADATADVELLCVASLVPRKGHLLLLEALARLRHLPWRLTCVGSPELDPDAAARVHAAVDALGLASRVTFTGAAIGADLDRAYERADAFVLATYYEGYGLAVAEAVARGLPVVCSDTGAAAALVGADSGVIVPPGEVEALTAALARVIGDDRAARGPGPRRGGPGGHPPDLAAGRGRSRDGAAERLPWRASALTGSPCASRPTPPPAPSR